MLTSCWYC